MDTKRFLFVTLDSLITDIAWQTAKEGHAVRFYTENAEDKEVGDGFVEKVDSWEEHVDWADVIVFDDTLGQGEKAEKLRAQGHLVVGGTPYTDRLEDDRSFGQEELRKHGINILPHHDFTSFADAIAFVRGHPGRYVIKPSGDAGNIKGLLFVGEEEDGKDVIQVLEDYNKAWAHKIAAFQLQKRVTGVEVAVGAFFNGKEFMAPINVNFENKKLFPGNLGPSTGEMGCYDDETEVLTDNGWKLFKDVLPGERLCTLNPETHQIEYHEPDCIVSFDHHKELLRIENQAIDVAVTLDHNMYVASQHSVRSGNPSFGFVKARDLEFQSLMPRTGNWVGEEAGVLQLAYGETCYDLGDQVLCQQKMLSLDADDFVSFLGAYIAEGSVGINHVSIAQSKKRSQERMWELVQKLPFSCSLRESEIIIYDKHLTNFLRQFGVSYQKRVPELIKGLSARQIKLFLEWYGLGDGTQMRAGHRIFYTSSKRLADDVQELLLKIGRVGTVKERAGRGNRWIVDHWADGSRTQYEVHERVKKGDSWLDKRDMKTVPYEGLVWCATVKNHIMYVRKNGKPYFCGNTAMFWSGPNKMFNSTLKKMEATFAEHGYVGYMDLNCIVNGNGIYPLEFTARFGYPTISIQQEGMITPIGEFLHGMASGELKTFKTKSGFTVGVRIVMPPFPFTDPETFEVKTKDQIIFFKKDGKDGVHIEDVKQQNGEWLVTGSSGVVLIVCGVGTTMHEAQKQCYNRIKNVMLPHMYYRDDIGDRWYEDSDRLHNWGYLREA